MAGRRGSRRLKEQLKHDRARCLSGRMRPYAEIRRIDFAVTVDLGGQSGRPPSPNLAARITRAYKLRQQPVEPRQRELPAGSFFVTVKMLFPSHPDFAGVCVAPATLRIIDCCSEDLEQTVIVTG